MECVISTLYLEIQLDFVATHEWVCDLDNSNSSRSVVQMKLYTVQPFVVKLPIHGSLNIVFVNVLFFILDILFKVRWIFNLYIPARKSYVSCSLLSRCVQILMCQTLIVLLSPVESSYIHCCSTLMSTMVFTQ